MGHMSTSDDMYETIVTRGCRGFTKRVYSGQFWPRLFL